MSILAYTGLPGAGKSYAVVEHQVLPALKAGRRVVTNIPLAWDLVRAEFPNAEAVELPLEKIQASPELMLEYVTPGSVLVLDEVWRIFPSGLKANQVPEPYRKLLAEHRHMVNGAGMACQIVLVTQDLAQIAAFARQLVEQTFRTVKLSSVGIRGGYRLDVFNGPISGPNPSLQGRLREIYGRYRPDVWKYYQSHTMSESATSGADERAVDKRGNMLRSPALLLAIGVVILGVLFIFPRATHLLEKKGMTNLVGAKEETSQGAQPPEAASHPAWLPPAPRAAATVQASAWRIVGWVQNVDTPDLSRVMLFNGTTRLVLAFHPICKADQVYQVVCLFQGQEITQAGPLPPPHIEAGLSNS